MQVINHSTHLRFLCLSVISVFFIGLSFTAKASHHSENTFNSYSYYKHYYNSAWWDRKYQKKQRKLNRYLRKNAQGFSNFKDTPLGSTGIPVIMLKVFPNLFPEIWGAPDDFFAPVGLMQDTFNPERTLPLGLGHSNSGTIIPVPVGDNTINVDIRSAQLSCMGCHTGKIEDKYGNIKPLIGAPNNQFDRFRYSVVKTVTHPNYTADNFRQAIGQAAAQGAGWLYHEPELQQQEALETGIFLSPGVAENFLGLLQQRVIAAATRSAGTIGTIAYGGDNAPDFNGPQAGLIDAYSNAALLALDPDQLSAEQLAAFAPQAPAFSDIMSTWQQKDRPLGQWDGSVASAVHRNIESAVAVTTSPFTIDVDNAIITNEFVQKLPSPPYPFAVSKHAAKKGRKLFKRHCASCHYPGATEVFDVESVGTDPNRADVLTPYVLQALTPIFRAACPEIIAECNDKDGEPFTDQEIIRITGGYQAIPLDGIWARAPYLHNGSVPTLAALLTGERPAQFYRGNMSYDETNVGFTWDRSETNYTMLYDTSLDGFDNSGHDTKEFNGNIDWAKNPKKLYYLLEYLKTL